MSTSSLLKAAILLSVFTSSAAFARNSLTASIALNVQTEFSQEGNKLTHSTQKIQGTMSVNNNGQKKEIPVNKVENDTVELEILSNSLIRMDNGGTEGTPFEATVSHDAAGRISKIVATDKQMLDSVRSFMLSALENAGEGPAPIISSTGLQCNAIDGGKILCASTMFMSITRAQD